MDAVTVTDLVVDRGRRRVLPGLSFAVPAGQVTGLLGPSGSGKTTLMRALVGVQQVRVRRGHRARANPPAPPPCAAGSATSPRRRASTTTSRVRENVRYFAALYGMGAREADAAVADVGLADAAGQLVARPVRRSAGPGLAGLRAGRRPGGARARRADRRAGPGAPRRAVGAVPRPGRRRDDADRLQPRDGRGRPLRPAAAAPRRRAASPTPRRRSCAPTAGPTTSRRRSSTWSAPARRWRHDRHDDRPAPHRRHAPEPPAHRGHRRPGAAPAAARPPHHRDDAGRCPACCSGCSTCCGRTCPTLPGQPGIFDRVGLTMLGHLPVRGHVPGHQHRDAPRAHVGHARAAAHHSPGPAGPAARLRARVRAGRRRAGAWSPSPSRRRSTTWTWPGRSSSSS